MQHDPAAHIVQSIESNRKFQSLHSYNHMLSCICPQIPQLFLICFLKRGESAGRGRAGGGLDFNKARRQASERASYPLLLIIYCYYYYYCNYDPI